MNRRPFVRKMIYLALIVALLVPLSLLSMPARRGNSQEAGSSGGLLAQMREKQKLSQANLGEIDATSETIKLATFGLRAIATFVLEGKAKQYELKEDWTKYQATLEQLSKLQPNFPNVWDFQSWNLAYNISAQFDDYHDRYFWHMEGIRYLQDGIRHNETAPMLMFRLGWIVAYKLGRSDEHLQFRRLFREDTDFNGQRKIEDRDNWLVGREFHKQAEAMASRPDSDPIINTLSFYARAPMCRIDYATALEEEGVLDERALAAWELALQEWTEFGAKEVLVGGRPTRMSDYDVVKQEIEKLNQKMAALPPGDVRALLLDEKRSKLSDAEKTALDKPAPSRTPDEVQLAMTAQPKIEITTPELVKRVDQDRQEEAGRIGKQLDEATSKLQLIDGNRTHMNYEYWRMRCDLERQPDTLKARQLTTKADHAFQVENNLPAAKDLYDQAFAQWDKVLDQFPDLRTNTIINEDMMTIIRRYRVLLDRLDVKEFPKDFPLQDIITAHPTGQ